MSVVSVRIVRRVIEASRGPDPRPVLLSSVGLSRESDAPPDDPKLVPAERYYALLERCGRADRTLPLRYGARVRPEDFGAFGLALKTAGDVRDALQRLSRYILLVSDTLEYTLQDAVGGATYVLTGRPSDARLGVQLANECALAAIVSLLRQVASQPVVPESVRFRHAGPATHAAWFEAPVRFEAAVDALHFANATLSIPSRLADDGLSAYLLAQLDALHAERAEGAVVVQVRRAITDRMCSGMPSRADIAKQLGMSPRTLHRRLAEHGCTFQDLANQVRRDAAESLLSRPQHSLAEVAYLTGFSDQSAFQRAFKSWTGQTPNGFRRA